MESETIRDIFRDKLNADPKSSLENMHKVKIIFCDPKKKKSDDEDFFAWADRDQHFCININDKFEKRLRSVSNKESEEIEESKETKIIIVFVSLVILHELAHLLLRWKGVQHSPTVQISEAGNLFEKCSFVGQVLLLVDSDTWNENAKISGNFLLFF